MSLATSPTYPTTSALVVRYLLMDGHSLDIVETPLKADELVQGWSNKATGRLQGRDLLGRCYAIDLSRVQAVLTNPFNPPPQQAAPSSTPQGSGYSPPVGRN